MSKVIELMLGSVRINVEVPEDMPPFDVSLSVRPKWPKDFERAAEMLGGMDQVRIPKGRVNYYDEPSHVGPVRGSQGVNVTAMLYPPPETTVEDSEPRPHPFYGPLAERIGKAST